jgi:hypothetical protein
LRLVKIATATVLGCFGRIFVTIMLGGVPKLHRSFYYIQLHGREAMKGMSRLQSLILCLEIGAFMWVALMYGLIWLIR